MNGKKSMKVVMHNLFMNVSIVSLAVIPLLEVLLHPKTLLHLAIPLHFETRHHRESPHLVTLRILPTTMARTALLAVLQVVGTRVVILMVTVVQVVMMISLTSNLNPCHQTLNLL